VKEASKKSASIADLPMSSSISWSPALTSPELEEDRGGVAGQARWLMASGPGTFALVDKFEAPTMVAARGAMNGREVSVMVVVRLLTSMLDFARVLEGRRERFEGFL